MVDHPSITLNFPKISIVVPSYNQGQYLEETLLSIIDQGYPDLELFVVDGGSTDNSNEIIKKYESHISWWVSEKDNGQSHAINKGLQKASGYIISWVNSDDLLLPGSLMNVATYFSKASDDIGLIHGGTILFEEAKEIKTDWGYSDPSLERNLSGMAFSQPAAFFLKRYLDEVGNKVSDDFHFGMDYDLFCRLACVCRFLPVKEIFSKYRLHESSKSVMDQDKFIGDWSRALINLCKNTGWNDLLEEMELSGFLDKAVLSYYSPYSFVPKKDIMDNADRKKILFYHYCYLLKAYYWNDNRIKARRLLKYLKQMYNADWLKREKDISPIMKKLSLPDFALRILKKIKNLV